MFFLDLKVPLIVLLIASSASSVSAQAGWILFAAIGTRDAQNLADYPYTGGDTLPPGTYTPPDLWFAGNQFVVRGDYTAKLDPPVGGLGRHVSFLSVSIDGKHWSSSIDQNAKPKDKTCFAGLTAVSPKLIIMQLLCTASGDTVTEGLYRSDDWGRSWIKLTLPSSATDGTSLSSILSLDDSIIALFQSNKDPSGWLLLQSADRGVTWLLADVRLPKAASYSMRLFGSRVIIANFANTTASVMLISNDAAKSWSIVHLPPAEFQMTGVTLCDGNYFVTGVLAPNKPVQFNSRDSGHSWHLSDALWQPNERSAICVRGKLFAIHENALMSSSDLGDNWSYVAEHPSQDPGYSLDILGTAQDLIFVCTDSKIWAIHP